MWRRPLLWALLILAAFLLQTTVLARLGLPLVVPNLVLVTSVAIAVVAGSRTGALVGFGAGLLMDLAPPSTSAAGIHALLLTLVGLTSGYWGRLTARTIVAIVGWTAGSAAVVVLGRGVLMALTSDLNWQVQDVLSRAVAGGIYAAVLTPLVAMTVSGLLRGPRGRGRVIVGDRDAGSAASYRG